MVINMPSEVISGSSNPTYNNTTGQNVRLIINFLKSATRVSWGLAASPVSILEGLINASYNALRTIDPYSASYGWYTRTGAVTSNPFSNIRELVIRNNNVTVYSGDGSGVIVNGQYAVVNGIKYTPGTYKGSDYGWSGDYSNTFNITLSEISPMKELMLGPGETFSSTCGEYNIVVIKENGS